MTTFCVRTLSHMLLFAVITALASGQWPARFNGQANGIDQVAGIAVDNRGNVYVTGFSQTTNNGYDVVTISYDRSGNQRTDWPARQYNGVGNGDDFATFIAVDIEGYVYVGGTSYGGTARGYDMFVIKYDLDGTPMWPSSGSGTEYDYHQGALRTTYDQDEGRIGLGTDVHVQMKLKDSLSSPQRLIAMTAQTRLEDGATGTAWRTVVFEHDPTALPARMRIKSGWPVSMNPSGSTQLNVPYSLDIASINDVIVGGTAFELGSFYDKFCVVRFKAAGKDGGTDNDARIWRHASSAYDGYNRCTSLALDASDNVYATGWLTASSTTTEYATYRLAASSGYVDWSDFYTNDGNSPGNLAASLGITLEVDSNNQLKPFIHITGLSGTSDDQATTTIRYRGEDGQREYVARYDPTTAIEAGFGLLAMGKGNAYVVGVTNANNYSILGYRKAGTTRFSPVSYDNGGFDQGRALASSGAGVLFYTGSSTGNQLDYLSGRTVETASSAAPSGQGTILGNVVSGSYSNLASNDESYFQITPVYSPGSFVPTVEVPLTGTCPGTDFSPTEMALAFDGHASISGVHLRLQLKDRLSGNWVTVADHVIAISDSLAIVPIKDDPARFINPITGALDAKVILYGGTSLNWTAYLDWFKWDVIGQ